MIVNLFYFCSTFAAEFHIPGNFSTTLRTSHVGDVVTHYDGLYQLKSNGEWVYIGEAEGASQEAYNQGYSDAIDDTYDDYSYYEDESYDDYYYDYGDYDTGYY